MKHLAIVVSTVLTFASATASTPKMAEAVGTTGVALTQWVPSTIAGVKNERPRNISVPSPDGRRLFEVREGVNGKPLIAVTSNGKPVAQNIEYEHQARLTWSPYSNAFYIEFTDAGSYDGWQVKVFLFEGEQLREYDDVGHDAKLEVAREFPPCDRGSNLNPDDCDMNNFAVTLNVFVLRWIAPDALAIEVQVPCSTSYGPNNCNFRVFEVSVPSGKILRSYTAQQARAKYPEYFRARTEKLAEP